MNKSYEKTEVKCYRKKPVIIRAIQWDGTVEGVHKIMRAFPKLWISYYKQVGDKVVEWRIKTLEGEYRISKGDFIVEGIKKEFYPVKPDIFKETYEEVDCDTDGEVKDDYFNKNFL